MVVLLSWIVVPDGDGGPASGPVGPE